MFEPRKVEAEGACSTASDKWSQRSQYWQAVYEALILSRRPRELQQAPLILTGNGLSLRVSKGALWIKEGLTHSAREAREYRFFPGGLDNPRRIVLVDGSGEITLDALDWLTDQEIPLIRLSWEGHVVSVGGDFGYAADPERVAWQVETRANEDARVAFGLPLIRQKIDGTLENLAKFFPATPERDHAVATAESVLETLEGPPPATVFELTSLERQAANAYFRVWAAMPIRWKASDRDTVPKDWLTYGSRSSLRATRAPSNRGATHPVNAMLNYVFGMLEIQTRIRVIADGRDPARGILHGDHIGVRDTFVFDLMEPGRPVAERSVLEMLRDHEFAKVDFMEAGQGSCRLDPSLAKVLPSFIVF